MTSPLFPSLILSISQIISRASPSSVYLYFLLFLSLKLFPPSRFLSNSYFFSLFFKEKQPIGAGWEGLRAHAEDEEAKCRKNEDEMSN